MANIETQPRQVRLLHCRIFSPGLAQRVSPKDTNLVKEGFNILPYVRRINLYESIFQNTMSGSMVFLDDVGLVEYIPIVGVEIVSVAFEVEDHDGEKRQYRHAFRVTKVHETQYARHQSRMFMMEFASVEFVQSMSSRISRSFTNQSCHKAVEQILTEDLKVEKKHIRKIEDTFGKLNTLIPNYTPLMAINYFATLAQTAFTPRESNFLFYETLDGFHFQSIQSMIRDRGEDKNLVTFDATSSLAHQRKVEDKDLRHNANRMVQEQSFDLLHDIASGMLRARMVHFDILARKLDTGVDSKYTDTFEKTTHLDRHPVYPRNTDKYVDESVRIFTVPSNFWTKDSTYAREKNEPKADQNMREAIILRNRQMKEIQHIQTVLEVPGHPRLQAGSVINVNYPSTRPLANKTEGTNTPVSAAPTHLHSGKHLITELQHIIAFNADDAAVYTMNIKACRDSLGTPLIGEAD